MFLPSKLRGGDLFLRSYAIGMAQIGWDVTWLYFVPEEPHFNVLSSRDLHEHGIKIVGPIPLHFNFLRLLLATEKYDMIFENYYANEQLFSLNMDVTRAVLKECLSTKLIAVAHDMFHLRTYQEGEKERALMFETLERLVFNEVDLVLTVNSHMTSSLSKQFINQNFGILSFTFDYPLMEGNMEVTPHNLHIPWNERTGILYVAADNPTNRQSLKFLCDAMSKCDSQKHVELRVYGTVPNLPECTGKTNVIHHGVANEETITAAAFRSRLFAVPCLTSVGISTKIVKFLSVGIPVLSTALCADSMPGSREKDFPVLVLSLEEFAERMFKAYADEKVFLKLHAESKKYYQKYFSSSALRKNLYAVHGQVSRITNRVEEAESMPVRKHVLVWDVSEDAALSFSSLNAVKDSLKHVSIKSVHYCRVGVPSMYLQWKWPVQTERPNCCPAHTCVLVYVVAWEMGQIPKVWTKFLKNSVDYVWTLSEYSTRMFLNAGINEMKIQTIPLGVNCSHPSPSTCSIRGLTESETTQIFLYIGGVLPRKGVDVILRSWCEAFTIDQDVALVIKVTYSHGGDEIMREIREIAGGKRCAKLILLEGFVDNINCLYDKADVLIHPARAEGFGLTPIEALSRGLVVLYNQRGATAEYMSSMYAVKIRSKMMVCKVWPCQGNSLCVFPQNGSWTKCEELEGAPFWYEPSSRSLTKALRHVHEHMDMWKDRAKYGKDLVCARYSWDMVSNSIDDKLRKIFAEKSGRSSHTRTITVKAIPLPYGSFWHQTGWTPG